MAESSFIDVSVLLNGIVLQVSRYLQTQLTVEYDLSDFFFHSRFSISFT